MFKLTKAYCCIRRGEKEENIALFLLRIQCCGTFQGKLLCTVSLLELYIDYLQVTLFCMKHFHLTLSASAFCLDFHTNSIIATKMPKTNPAINTRNIPPIFSSPSSLASSFWESSLVQWPVRHHLFFKARMTSSSWSCKMALVIWSRIGSPGCFNKGNFQLHVRSVLIYLVLSVHN